MQAYSFKAINNRGEVVKSTVQADDEQKASSLIRAQGLSPIEINSISNNGIPVIGALTNRVSSKDIIIFSRQMSTLINAGLPLVQSLRSVSDQTDKKAMSVIISSVISEVESGKSLNVALASHPRAFNSVYTSLISAGEASGTLDRALERIAIQQEKDAEVKSKIRGAMIYPLIVLGVMLAVVGFMVVVVVPQVQGLFEGFKAGSLPIQTRILIAISKFTRQYWYLIIAAIVAIGFVSTKYARTLGGKQFIDSFKLKAPIFKTLFMKVYMARFARTGATLIASGVPLIQMLEIVGNSIGNVHVKKSLDLAIEDVKGGKALSNSIANDPNFLPLVPNMLRIGEQSGAIEDMLNKVAEYYEKEVDNTIKSISTIIEPLLMVILGLVAMGIVSAILLPIYSLANKIQQG